MPITFSCGCGKTLKAPETSAGRKVKCPGCGAVLVVPSDAPAPAVPPPPKHGPMFIVGIVVAVVVGLVVVGGIMMAILLPAIMKARRNAELTKCRSQMSQIIKACYNYSVTKSPIEGQFHDHVSGGEWVYWMKTPGNEITDWKVLN